MPSRSESLSLPPITGRLREGSLFAGRLPECDVVLNDGLVSRMRAHGVDFGADAPVTRTRERGLEVERYARR